jgi:cytochrome c biogenesis protein CcmG, thiol:disulfide interchange protein DsbE
MSTSRSDRILLVLLGIAVLGFAYTISPLFEQRVVAKGDQAPDFQITTDSGKVVKLNDFGGKILVLNFWATWCPPCIQEMPSLNQFADAMKDKGVVVLGVSIDRNQATYKRFVQENRLSFVTANDPEAGIAADYGTFKWPETYIIDTKGKVLEKHIGPKDWMSPEILNPIKALL